MEIRLSKKEINRLKKKWIKKYSEFLNNLPDSEFNACANGLREFEIKMCISKDTSF